MKAKTLLLSLFLSLAVFGLKAQDKYEYAIISYSPYWANISISIGGQNHEIIPVADNKLKERKLNAILEEVNKMQEQGWEVFSVQAINNNAPTTYTLPDQMFYLRRKK